MHYLVTLTKPWQWQVDSQLVTDWQSQLYHYARVNVLTMTARRNNSDKMWLAATSVNGTTGWRLYGNNPVAGNIVTSQPHAACKGTRYR